MFQGGFAGKNCKFFIAKEGSDKFEKAKPFFPKDINHLQVCIFLIFVDFSEI